MTSTEFSLLNDLFQLKLAYMDCNPEVGFGPFPQVVLNELLEKYVMLAKQDMGDTLNHLVDMQCANIQNFLLDQ